MDTKNFTPLLPGTRYQLPDGKTTVTFGTDEAPTSSEVTSPKPKLPADPLKTPQPERGWIKFCKVMGAGMGTGLSWSFRPLMTKIATTSLIEAGVPKDVAIAIGVMLAELVINPPLIGTGTTTAELISNRVQRLFSGGNVIGAKDRSPDFLKDLGDAIGVGFTTMAFALAYEGAGKTTETSWETYAPALLGGALTGAFATLTTMMAKDLRRLDLFMREKPLPGGHSLVMETPADMASPGEIADFQAKVAAATIEMDLESKGTRSVKEDKYNSSVESSKEMAQEAPEKEEPKGAKGHYGERLCHRLSMSAKDRTALEGFFKDRMKAAFEMNREMVMGAIPVLHAQILLAYLVPLMDPAPGKPNILNLHDLDHMTKETQYKLVVGLLTALVHNKRVEGWTNHLTGTPTPKIKQDFQTSLVQMARQLVPAVVNGAVALVSSYIAAVASSPEKMSAAIQDQFAAWGDLGDGSHQQILQLAGGMICGMALLRAVAGPNSGVNLKEVVTSGFAGAFAGFTGSAQAQFGAVVGAASHALVQPTHDNLVLPKDKELTDDKASFGKTAREYARGFAKDGVLGYTRQIARPLQSMAEGGFHAITRARSYLPAAVGGASGGALVGGLTAASLTAGGIISMPTLPVAFVAGAGASVAGSLLGMLTTACRGGKTWLPDWSADGKQPARSTVELQSPPNTKSTGDTTPADVDLNFSTPGRPQGKRDASQLTIHTLAKPDSTAPQGSDEHVTITITNQDTTSQS